MVLPVFTKLYVYICCPFYHRSTGVYGNSRDGWIIYLSEAVSDRRAGLVRLIRRLHLHDLMTMEQTFDIKSAT